MLIEIGDQYQKELEYLDKEIRQWKWNYLNCPVQNEAAYYFLDDCVKNFREYIPLTFIDTERTPELFFKDCNKTVMLYYKEELQLIVYENYFNFITTVFDLTYMDMKRILYFLFDKYSINLYEVKIF